MNMRFAFDGCGQRCSDIRQDSVALSNAILSVGGSDHWESAFHFAAVTPLTDPLIQFAFDGCDQCARDIQLEHVALSNAISSVSGGDHKGGDIHFRHVILLTDPLIQFAFGSCDQYLIDTHLADVAPSNAIPSVGGSDQIGVDIHQPYVTPLTDPLIKFAFDGCDQFDDDIQTTSVALSNAIPSVSNGDHIEGVIHLWIVTPLIDPLSDGDPCGADIQTAPIASLTSDSATTRLLLTMPKVSRCRTYSSVGGVTTDHMLPSEELSPR